MKPSRYNIFLQKEGRRFVFNQLASAILEVDESLFCCLQNEDLSLIPLNVQNELAMSSILVDDDLNEENVVSFRVLDSRMAKSSVRVTIMPTLDCNFSCWYCYEKHKKSMMSEEAVCSILRFCESEILKPSTRNFHLDWFGGEPLLYFNEVVEPIATRIMNLCEENGVKFLHSITTNGYLINSEMIQRLKSLKLRSYQITLDGSAQYHNKTRFSATDKNSYSAIVSNVINLCQEIEDIDMMVRINYTPKNIISLEDIANDFPLEIRNKILLFPQLVWQFKKNINAITERIKDVLKFYKECGYKSRTDNLTVCQCYAESIAQYVINYDLSVYKCTARDFSANHSVGSIKNGVFLPNSHYFDYSIRSDVEKEECRGCKLLPSCFGRCVQKRVENSVYNCDKEALLNSIFNNLYLYLDEHGYKGQTSHSDNGTQQHS